MDTTVKLYESIDVWKRQSEKELVCYRCFRNLETNMYSVQSSDFYTIPVDANRLSFLQKQYLELLSAQAPDEREPEFQTLAEAINAHDRTFDVR